MRTTCWSEPCRPRSCVGWSSCPPAAWACGWSRAGRRARRRRRGRAGRAAASVTALLELWEKRQDNALTLAAYRESAACTAPWRDSPSTYARIPDGRKQLVRAIALRLVGEGEGEANAPVRRRAPLAELDLECNEDVADVLATLADSRLVSVGEGSVEVAHEALLREWPRLREWIEQDAEGRRFAHITQAAAEWHASGRDQGKLYRGARLAAALDGAATHSLDLNQLERVRGREPEVAEQEAKRARRTPAPPHPAGRCGSSVGGALAGGRSPSSSAGRARRGDRTLAQRLGAQALVEEDFDRSLLLARQAVAIDDSPQTRSYLLADLLRAPAVTGVMHGQATSPRSRSAQTGARSWSATPRRAPLLRRPDLRADREAGAGERRGGEPRVQPRWADGRVRWIGHVRLIDRARGSSLPRSVACRTSAG